MTTFPQFTIYDDLLTTALAVAAPLAAGESEGASLGDEMVDSSEHWLQIHADEIKGAIGDKLSDLMKKAGALDNRILRHGLGSAIDTFVHKVADVITQAFWDWLIGTNSAAKAVRHQLQKLHDYIHDRATIGFQVGGDQTIAITPDGHATAWDADFHVLPLEVVSTTSKTKRAP